MDGLTAGMAFFEVPSMDGHLRDRAPGEVFDTQFGVTRMTYDAAVEAGVEVKPWDQWTVPEDSRPVYKWGYWDKLDCDELPACVAMVAFVDSCLMGTGTVARNLQAIAGVEQDGKIGPATRGGLSAMAPSAVAKALDTADLQHLRGLANWGRFENGWMARESELIAAALKLS